MVSLLELKSRWQEALTSGLESEDEECMSILCENDWVRILAIVDPEAPRRIEVEVSLPSQQDPQSGEDVSKFVQDLIKHLEYLLRLYKEGMTLSVMTRDGLWTAFLDMEKVPQDSLFNALIPPS